MDSAITNGNIIDDTDSAKVAHAKAAKIETTQTSRTTHANAPSIEDGADAALVMSLEPTIAKSSNMSQMPSWECVACTYVNDNILGLACEMCQTEKPLPGPVSQHHCNDESILIYNAAKKQRLSPRKISNDTDDGNAFLCGNKLDNAFLCDYDNQGGNSFFVDNDNQGDALLRQIGLSQSHLQHYPNAYDAIVSHAELFFELEGVAPYITPPPPDAMPLWVNDQ